MAWQCAPRPYSRRWLSVALCDFWLFRCILRSKRRSPTPLRIFVFRAPLCHRLRSSGFLRCAIRLTCGSGRHPKFTRTYDLITSTSLDSLRSLTPGRISIPRAVLPRGGGSIWTMSNRPHGGALPRSTEPQGMKQQRCARNRSRTDAAFSRAPSRLEPCGDRSPVSPPRTRATAR